MNDINTNMQIASLYNKLIGESLSPEEAKNIQFKATDQGITITCVGKSGQPVSVSVPELEAPKTGTTVDAKALLNKMLDVCKLFTSGSQDAATFKTRLADELGKFAADMAKLNDTKGGGFSREPLTSIYAIIQLLFEAGVELRKAAWEAKNASDMQQVSTILGQAEQQRQNALTGVSAAFASMGLQVAAMALPSIVQGLASNKADAAKSAVGMDAFKQMADNSKLEGDLPKASDDVSVAETKLDGLLTSSNKSGTSDPALEQIGDLGFTKKDIVEAVSGFDDNGNVRLNDVDQASLKNALAQEQASLKKANAPEQAPLKNANASGDGPNQNVETPNPDAPQVQPNEPTSPRAEFLEAKLKTAKAATELKKAGKELQDAKLNPDAKNVPELKAKYDTALNNYKEAVQNGVDLIEGRFGGASESYLKQLDGSRTGFHGFNSKLLGGRTELGKGVDNVNQLKQATVFAHALKTKELSKTVDGKPLSLPGDKQMNVMAAKQKLSEAKNRLNDTDVYTNNLERSQTARTWREGLTMALRGLDQIVQYGVHSMEADVTARGAQAKMEEIKSDTAKRMLDDAAQLCQRAIQFYDMAQQSELSVIQKVMA